MGQCIKMYLWIIQTKLCIISCNCRVTKCTKLVKPIIELNFREEKGKKDIQFTWLKREEFRI